MLFHACTKCDLNGDVVLSDSFDEKGDWLLYGEVVDPNQLVIVEDGMLKMKTNDTGNCVRATYYFTNDFSNIKGFKACFHVNEFHTPKYQSAHFYIRIGKYELHATIGKRQSSNTALFLKMDKGGPRSNLRGAVYGNINHEELNNFDTSFVQIALCPEEFESSTGELYLEIDKVEIVTY